MVISLGQSISGNAVRTMLDQAHGDILQTIQKSQDGVIRDGLFDATGSNNLFLRVANANNHQTTYGVLGAALEAVHGFMSSKNRYYGKATFSIFDGTNQVGQGVIGD